MVRHCPCGATGCARLRLWANLHHTGNAVSHVKPRRNEEENINIKGKLCLHRFLPGCHTQNAFVQGLLFVGIYGFVRPLTYDISLTAEAQFYHVYNFRRQPSDPHLSTWLNIFRRNRVLVSEAPQVWQRCCQHDNVTHLFLTEASSDFANDPAHFRITVTFLRNPPLFDVRFHDESLSTSPLTLVHTTLVGLHSCTERYIEVLSQCHCCCEPLAKFLL